MWNKSYSELTPAEIESERTRLREYRRLVPQKYTAEQKQAALAYHRAYEKRHRSRLNVMKTAHRARVKAKLFELMGGRCVRCGFEDIRALQVDHVNGVPAGLRRVPQNPHRGGYKLYLAILAGKYALEDFQLLCANCNWIKRVVNREYLDYPRGGPPDGR